MENYIKELKGRFGMEQMPCGDFFANALYFALGVLVYNTIVAQKLFLLPAEWAKKTIHTMRWALIQVAGKAVRHGRGLTLKLTTTYEKYIDFISICNRGVWRSNRLSEQIQVLNKPMEESYAQNLKIRSSKTDNVGYQISL